MMFSGLCFSCPDILLLLCFHLYLDWLSSGLRGPECDPTGRHPHLIQYNTSQQLSNQLFLATQPQNGHLHKLASITVYLHQ